MSSAILLACEALVPGVLSCWQISRRKDIPKSLHDWVGPDHEQETAHFPCQTNMAWHVPGFLLPHISSGSGTCPFLGHSFNLLSLQIHGRVTQSRCHQSQKRSLQQHHRWLTDPPDLVERTLPNPAEFQEIIEKKTVLGMNWIMNLNIGKWRFTLW